MKFRLKIDCSNDAFEYDSAEEVGRILRELGERMQCGYTPDTLRDANGNTVGACLFYGGK